MTDLDGLKQIGAKLSEAKSILLFPHIHVDGDALGSAACLCKALRNLGKKAYILVEDDIANNLKFLDRGYCTDNPEIIGTPDLSVCIDCGDPERFKERKDAFMSGREKMCIDHHRTTKAFTEYSYVDSDASATGTIIYDLCRVMDWPLDVEMGEAVFAAITTDTGNFQYSNTTKHDHEIMIELYDLGIDYNRVSIEIYENISFGKLRLDNDIIGTLELFSESRGAIAYVTQKMLDETGTEMNDTEGIVGTLRSISGVEIAAFLKERAENEISVSMRAKTVGDVAEISEEFDGGGHTKAAGCTLYMSMEEAKELIKDRIAKQLARL